MNETILVAGGAGFIGSNLVEELLKRGNKVIAIDNLVTGSKENVELFSENKNYSFMEHDITESFFSLGLLFKLRKISTINPKTIKIKIMVKKSINLYYPV